MPDNIEEVYDEMAEYIQSKDGQCALILGPELSVDQNGISYKSCFRKMEADEHSGIFKYFEEDNLFSFKDENGLKTTRRSVKEFYNNSGDAGLLEMIARIRFPLIINVCPDLALNRTYDQRKIPYEYGYFSKDSKPMFKDLPKPSRELPVIYNIFGSVDAPTSLILNHSKLYETIQYLLPDNSLPENIETFLNQASGFILLGFKFESWYYQLICHKLKLKEYNKSKTNLSASNCNDTDSVSVVMRKHFEIDFTPDNPMQAMERLIGKCNGNQLVLRDVGSLAVYSLFSSYAWKDEGASSEANRETVLDWLQKYSGLKDLTSLLFYRDRNDLNYGDSIDSYMTRIGKGKVVIRVISDKYLKSAYCMTEALRMDKYRDEEQRIIDVVFEDADLDHEIIYRDHWRGECHTILEDLDNANYDIAVEIYRFLPKFIKGLQLTVGLRVEKKDFIIDQPSGNIIIIKDREEVFKNWVAEIIEKIKVR